MLLRSLIILLLVAGVGATPISKAPTAKTVSPDAYLRVGIIPRLIKGAIRPQISARSVLLVDVDTGLSLYEKNARLRMPMASLTKIMTAVMILGSHRPSEVVDIQDDFNQYTDLGVRIWLHQYEKITVGDLLTGLLVPSAGDAAVALAEYHSGSVEKFVEAMNAKARELGLRDTHFKNPIGLDEEGHYSTAFDLATLTRYALRFPEFRRIVALPEASISSTNGKITHSFKSTDELLGGYLDIRGVKTGTTDEAGQSVVNLARNPASNKEVISVILDSTDRFQESKSLIDWSFRNYLW